MPLTLKITIFVLALIVTGVMFYLSLSPTYVLQISVVPDPNFVQRAELSRDKTIVIYGGKEPIYFDVTGSVTNPNTPEVVLKLHGPKDADFTEVKPSFPVSNGTFIGVVKLGSAESPIVSDVNYTYDLSAKNGSRLSVGHIQSQVKAVILGTIPWWMVIIGAMGLLASFLQVVQFVYTKKGESHAAPLQPSSK
jgi:hypothetical protein